MESGEILDLAMRVYQNCGLALLRTTAVPALFCFAALAFVLQVAAPQLFVTEQAGSTAGQIGEAVATLGLGLLVGGPLFLIGASYASGVCVFLVSDFIDGRDPNEAAAHAGARRSLVRLFGFHIRELIQAWSPLLLAFAGMAAGALLADALPENNMWPAVAALLTVFFFVASFFVVPFVLARHALAAASICIENQRVGSAVRRSLNLMRGAHWAPSGYMTVVSLYLVVGLLGLLIWIGAGASVGLFRSLAGIETLHFSPALSAVLERALGMIPLFIAVWTIVPVWCTTTTLLYYERRIRLEGYDIFALAQEVWRTDRQSRFEL